MASSGFKVLVFRQALRFGSTTTMSMPMSSSPLPLRLSGDLFPYQMYSSFGVRFSSSSSGASHPPTYSLIAFFMGRMSKSPEEPKSSESAKESAKELAKVGADGVGLRVRVASHSYMEVTSGVHMFFVLMSGMAAEDIHFALEQDSGILWVRLDAHRRDYTAIEDGLAAYRCRFPLPETVSGTPTCHVRMERGSLKIVINEIDGTFCMKVPKCTEKNEFRFGDFPGVPF